MAKPVKHGSKWRVRWKDHRGRRKSRVFHTYKEAETALRRYQVKSDDIRSGVLPLPASPRGFDELCQKYLDNRTSQKRRKRDDESIVRVHFISFFAGTKIQGIDIELVDEYKKQKSHLHRNTLHHHRPICCLRHGPRLFFHQKMRH